MKQAFSFLVAAVLTAMLFQTSSQGQTVTIGKQVWMTKNLDVSTFRNGDSIPQAKTNTEWQEAGDNKQPAWCYYDNDPKNGEKYAKLYNWYAVADLRGLCPSGWHVPSLQEWVTLIEFLGGYMASIPKLKSKSGWGNGGNGTNTSGFSGLPGGFRYDYGSFYLMDYYGSWWISTEIDEKNAWNRYLDYTSAFVEKYSESKSLGISVRCLKD